MHHTRHTNRKTHIKSAFCDSKTYDCASEASYAILAPSSPLIHTRLAYLRDMVNLKRSLTLHIKVPVSLQLVELANNHLHHYHISTMGHVVSNPRTAIVSHTS